jgi:hypothetical protein
MPDDIGQGQIRYLLGQMPSILPRNTLPLVLNRARVAWSKYPSMCYLSAL